MKIRDAFERIETGAKFAPRQARPRRHHVSTDSPDKVSLLDLNIKETAFLSQGKHLIDIIREYDGPVDVDALCALLKDNKYTSLPEPFKEKQPTNQLYHMQVNLNKEDNGKWLIIKWFIFEEKQIFNSIQDKLIYGEAFQPTWTAPAYVSH
eukprot:12427215-Karenia_brevis.AAC.1